MSTYERALELVQLIEAQDSEILATCDPRSATPPCVLVVPPTVDYNGYCSGTAQWSLYALASTTGNADVWKDLERMLSIVAAALPVERAMYVSYVLSPDAPIFPAYQITFTQGVDLA